ncbi:GNAT family N-acetyltransferase [Larsenimonas rhizosphaerae]|uniref:GNAT family N-acetyltransferase n=1 Tax=Larsenimonas rhizosphaerae TaxID=2944682 RepID=UPI0020344214|nr:GNAT family N-acetyltransferase [Larsenimonas rhizosphaerae]MCM2129782.1 GNAT family N-acetyltransferase [Larsenimonas rhizosphaerae]
MPICETPRLVIRPLVLEDVPALTNILSDPDVMTFSVRGVCDEAATRHFVEECLAGYIAHGFGPWALEDRRDGALVGFCGIGPEHVAGVEEISLGYRLARRYWGQGLASEAAAAVLDHAFGRKQCASVVAIIAPDHVASQKVVGKVGFGSFELQPFHDRTVRVYRLTQRQWQSSERGVSPSQGKGGQ